MNMITQPEGLISVLLDKSARDDERDDAAMDLSLYPSTKAIEALFEIATDESEDVTILDSCGESLASIWIELNSIEKSKIKMLTSPAYNSAKRFIQGYRPEWIIYFEKN